ncbi:MAG: lysostaphin resistance A-like protein, partial [Nitrospirales bacterium]
DTLPQVIAWYEELIQTHDARNRGRRFAPAVELRLAILKGEARWVKDLERLVADWPAQPTPYPLLAQLIVTAYLLDREPPAIASAELVTLAETSEEWPADLDAVLPPGWFQDRLRLRLGEALGNTRWISEAEASLEQRAKPLLVYLRWSLAGEVVILSVGTWFLIGLVRNRLRVASAPLPPWWRGRDGLTVLVRGAAVGVVLLLGLLVLAGDLTVVQVLAVPVASLPLLGMAGRYLLEPVGRNLEEGFGLEPDFGAWSAVGAAVLAIVALGLWGEWFVALAADVLGLTTHWTESFDENLLWGDLLDVAITLAGYILIVPIVEELVFRGLLYGTLRRRFGVVLSAVLSAGLFALAHGYGWIGWASVFWSGLIWAWAYEQTRSLLPGMVAHAVNNLLVCLTMIWVYRV